MLYLSKLFIAFLIFSFGGWILEVLYGLWKEKKFVNRGFLIGPICPIYGAGGILLYLILSNFKDDAILLFIMSCIICSILEYASSYLLEKIFGVRWWDYEYMKFNINGRICLEMVIPFGMLGLFVVYLALPYIMNVIGILPNLAIYIIAGILFIIFLIDSILSISIITIFKKKALMSNSKDNTEEISKYVRKTLLKESKSVKRLLDAFPNFKIKMKKRS